MVLLRLLYLPLLRQKNSSRSLKRPSNREKSKRQSSRRTARNVDTIRSTPAMQVKFFKPRLTVVSRSLSPSASLSLLTLPFFFQVMRSDLVSTKLLPTPQLDHSPTASLSQHFLFPRYLSSMIPRCFVSSRYLLSPFFPDSSLQLEDDQVPFPSLPPSLLYTLSLLYSLSGFVPLFTYSQATNDLVPFLERTKEVKS